MKFKKKKRRSKEFLMAYISPLSAASGLPQQSELMCNKFKLKLSLPFIKAKLNFLRILVQRFEVLSNHSPIYRIVL
jgi:hypothetical protein